MESTTTLLAAALWYADLGYPVFPLIPGDKRPATKNGLLDATTDEEQIRKWWSENCWYGIGIRTDGNVLVDIDGADNPWIGTLTAEQQNDLMAAPCTLTPRGGQHRWMRENGREIRNSTGKLAKRVDVRGRGGYVVAPPSSVGGKQYRWAPGSELDGPPETLPVVPDWITDRLIQKEPTARLSKDAVGQEEAEPFMDHTRNESLTRLAGSLRHTGMTAKEIWPSIWQANKLRCRPPLERDEVERIIRSVCRYEPSDLTIQGIRCHFTLPGDLDPEAEPEPTKDVVLSRFPTEILDGMPPMMRIAFEYALATAVKPQPILTLGALIPLFGAIYGRKVRDDYKTRSNVMVLNLAPSGAGKEHPRQCNKLFLMRADMAIYNGPEGFGSHQGIVASLAGHPIRLFQVDEFGRLVQTMKDGQRSPWLFNIGTMLMKIFSSSGSIWQSDAVADPAKVKTLYYPCLCLLGTSISDGFWQGISPDTLADGLLGRMLLMETEGYGVRQHPADIEVPAALIDHMRWWHSFVPGGGGLVAAVNPDPLLVAKTKEASERHEAYCNDVHDRHRGDSEVGASLWARSPEKAAKLALIYACASAGLGELPVIDLKAEEWGIAVVNYATRRMLQGAENSVVRSKWEGEKRRLWKVLRDSQTIAELTRRTQWLRDSERRELLDALKLAGAIELEITAGKTKPKTIIRRLRERL